MSAEAMLERLAEFRASITEMRHGSLCATRLDSPDADCSCERAAVLEWISYVERGDDNARLGDG